jgi:hypothetical protein
MNGAVWDIENGTILKLTEDCLVSHAISGFKTLTEVQIRGIYGDPPIYNWLKWPKSIR